MIVMRTEVVVHLAKMSELGRGEVKHWAKMYEMKNQGNWSEMRHWLKIHEIEYLLE